MRMWPCCSPSQVTQGALGHQAETCCINNFSPMQPADKAQVHLPGARRQRAASCSRLAEAVCQGFDISNAVLGTAEGAVMSLTQSVCATCSKGQTCHITWPCGTALAQPRSSVPAGMLAHFAFSSLVAVQISTNYATHVGRAVGLLSMHARTLAGTWMLVVVGKALAGCCAGGIQHLVALPG
jgi:hypothetical protein